MDGLVVEVGGRRFAIPYECPCCGADPDGELGVALAPEVGRPVAPDTAHVIGFPYCKRCIAHVARWESITNIETGMRVVGLVTGILLGLVAHWAAGLAVFAAAAIASLVAGRSLRARLTAEGGEACACPALAVGFLGWTGTATVLRFESHVYAARFAERNHARLVNVDTSLREALREALRETTDGHKLARLAVPTPASAVGTVPAPATLDVWLARVEGARGRVARHDVLARGLDALAEPVERAALVDAAVRRELATMRLERPRDVQRALVAVRADNMPDELREALVRVLSERQRSLPAGRGTRAS